jgi:hypothetical protein
LYYHKFSIKFELIMKKMEFFAPFLTSLLSFLMQQPLSLLQVILTT